MYHVRVFFLIDDPSILELDIEVLIDRMEGSLDRQIILQLHRHLLPHQFLEVGEEKLWRQKKRQIYRRLQTFSK